MSEAFAQSILKVAMAQICQNLGWHAVQSSPMNILVDILRRYICTVAKITHQYSEHYNHTQPDLNDLGLAFKELGISLTELEEYINNVEPVPFVHSVPKFPVTQSSNFHFPKEGCREVQHRPEWIHPHLPPAYPELEEDEAMLSPTTTLENKAFIDGLTPTPEVGVSSPCGSPRPGMRRPLEVSQDNYSTPKRPRLQSEEEGRPMREVMSVTMTAAGVISSVREGRLPDACSPSKGFDDSRPATPVASEIVEPVVSPIPPEVPELPPVPVPEETSEKVKVKPPAKPKEAKKIKAKKENKENKKKVVKEGKVRKKDPLGKIKGLGRPPKIPRIKKEKVEKSPKNSEAKPPKVPKVPKPKIPKSKDGKGAPKAERNTIAKAKGGAKLANKPGRKHNLKLQKPPKVPKPKKKSPKAERLVPGGHMANLLAKASGAATVKAEKMTAESTKLPSREKEAPVTKMELPVTPVASNSPEHLIIDDTSSINEGQDRESRLAALDECISAVIQHGMHSEQHTANSNSSSNARSDSEGIPSIPSRIKLEPRDVYDFTDDDEVPGGVVSKNLEEPTNFPPHVLSPPVKRREEDRDKPKEPRKVKKKDVEKKPKKQRGRSPKFIKSEPETNPLEMMRPRTPEPVEDSNDGGLAVGPFMSAPTPGVPMIPSYAAFSSLSHIPPALLPFSMQGYPPPPVCTFLGSAGPSTSVCSGLGAYPKLVDLADVAISKARNEGDFDVGKPKEKDKEKTKRKEKREKKEKEKEKLKLKKKREKTKDKVVEKSPDKNHEKGRGRKSKAPAAKTKEKKEKVEKGKDKEKKKEKVKDKVKEKKVDKKKKEKGVKKEKPEKAPKEEVEAEGGSPSINNLPRLTFKLGSGVPSDGTKIVIKGLSNTDSPSSSPVPQISEQSPPASPPPLPPPPPPPPPPVQRAPPPPPPPPVSQTVGPSTSKSHPKPSSKGQAVPPARTVISKTVGTIIDEAGNKIWICPACTLPDDGSPMIGCDDCDEWYHWVCVGIVVPPKEDENWFCTRCISKKQSTQKKRKHRKEK